MKVYILIDDYTPDAGSTIYGVYATKELAKARLAELENENNEYGQNINENDTIEIQEYDVEKQSITLTV